MSQTAPHQAIYRRWRAQTFAQIVGQEAVVETLRNAVRTNRVAHAILLVGPRGTGKTSLARILAKAINCTDLRDGDPCDACPSCVAIREGRAMDLVEIDAASNRGIDAIRELRERINYAPTDLRRKVYILDEAHQITKDAWNALLKSLEEPPDFVVFMFASTHPQDFPPAILSRLQRFDVRRLTTDEIEGKLRRILDADGREAEPGAVHLIARLAAGGMRDAESMLDQLISSSAGALRESQVRDLLGLADTDALDAYVDALVEADALAGIRVLDGLEERGRDLRLFLEQLIETLRAGIVGSSTEPAVARHSVASLAGVARRLAAIDPNRAGVGGLRLQLELALFPVASGPVLVAGPSAPVAVRPVPAAPRTAPADAAARSVDAQAATPVAPPDRSRSTRAVSPAEAATPEAAGSTAPAAAPKGPSRRAPGAAPTSRSPEVSASSPAVAGASSSGRASTPIESPAPLAPPAASGDLELLRERWPEVVARISSHPPTKPLIVACRPISVDDAVVTLGFPEDQGFLRTVAERRRAVLEEGIGAVLGRSVSVRCVATNLDLVPPVEPDGDAAYILAEARRIFGDDATDAAEVS